MVVNRDRVVLADTNIISYAFKRLPTAAPYNRLLVGREVRVSFTTVAELHACIAATAMHHNMQLVTHDANFLATEGLRVLSANPEIIALQALSPNRSPLDMDMHCRCGM